MRSRRRILEHLTRDTLRDLADAAGLQVGNRRARNGFEDALAAAGHLSLEDLLDDLYRDELKKLCRGLGLSDIGRTKAELVARILGETGPGEESPGPAVPQPARAVP